MKCIKEKMVLRRHNESVVGSVVSVVREVSVEGERDMERVWEIFFLNCGRKCGGRNGG